MVVRVLDDEDDDDVIVVVVVVVFVVVTGVVSVRVALMVVSGPKTMMMFGVWRLVVGRL